MILAFLWEVFIHVFLFPNKRRIQKNRQHRRLFYSGWKFSKPQSSLFIKTILIPWERIIHHNFLWAMIGMNLKLIKEKKWKESYLLCQYSFGGLGCCQHQLWKLVLLGQAIIFQRCLPKIAKASLQGTNPIVPVLTAKALHRATSLIVLHRIAEVWPQKTNPIVRLVCARLGQRGTNPTVPVQTAKGLHRDRSPTVKASNAKPSPVVKNPIAHNFLCVTTSVGQ